MALAHRLPRFAMCGLTRRHSTTSCSSIAGRRRAAGRHPEPRRSGGVQASLAAERYTRRSQTPARLARVRLHAVNNGQGLVGLALRLSLLSPRPSASLKLVGVDLPAGVAFRQDVRRSS